MGAYPIRRLTSLWWNLPRYDGDAGRDTAQSAKLWDELERLAAPWMSR